MKKYSNSKIQTFDNCRLKYKYKYIDKKDPVVPQTIEAFLGDKVHRTLEKLYQDLKYEKDNTKEDLIKHYRKIWEEEWDDDILIVKDYEAKHYKKKGERMIKEYYDRKKPFNQAKTIGLETTDYYELDDERKIHIRIDRLASPEENIYEIHDYKTSNTLKSQDEADRDLQLRIYALGVKNMYPNAEKITLIWHYLEHNREVKSEIQLDSLEEIEQRVLKKIDDIEEADEYPPRLSPLCDYCEYKKICPLWKHKYADDTGIEIDKERGKELVEKYVKLKEKEEILEDKLDTIKDYIYSYAEEYDVKALHGDHKSLTIWTKDVLKFDESSEEFQQALDDLGLLDDYLEINTWQLEYDFDDLDISSQNVLEEFGEETEIKRIYIRD